MPAPQHAASIKELLIAGVHFGHQTRRWNPKMKHYIFGERGGIYIIDLQKTSALLDESYAFLKRTAERGGHVLFVGTKKQCQETIKEQADRIGMPYVSNRWLGGLLTNYNTLSKRIKRMHELRQRDEDGSLDLLPSREAIKLRGDLRKLEQNLGGVQGMDRLPAAVFVVDPRKEQIVVKEARKLKIPIVALVDTNCDPDEVDYVIPGNDDAIRSCGLIVRVIADAVAEGKQLLTEAEMKAEAERKVAEAKRKAEEEAAEAKRKAEEEAAAAVAAEARAKADAEAAKVAAEAPKAPAEKPAAPAAKVEAKPEAKAEAKPAPKVEAKPEPKVEVKHEPKAEAKGIEPEAKPVKKPAAKKLEKAEEPKAEAKPQKTEKAPEAEAKPAKKPAAKKTEEAEAPKAEQPVERKAAKAAEPEAKPAKKPATKKPEKAEEPKADAKAKKAAEPKAE